MGFNTTLIILNDHLSHIENDAEFGRRVADAIRRLHTSRGEPVDFGTGAAIETHHADGLMAVLIGGNTGRLFGYAGNVRMIGRDEDGAFKILSNLAFEHGYELKRRGGPKWSLDVQRARGGPWQTVAEKPSADGCKAAARQWRDNQVAGSPAFRLYDPMGCLHSLSFDNRSWRMKWRPAAKGYTREQMAQRDAA